MLLLLLGVLLLLFALATALAPALALAPEPPLSKFGFLQPKPRRPSTCRTPGSFGVDSITMENNALLDGSSVSNSNNWCLSQSKLLAFMTDRLLARHSSGQCARCMDGPHEEPTLANRLCVSLESSFRGSTCMGELARSRCSNQADLFDLFSRPGVSGLLSAVVTSRRQRICG